MREGDEDARSIACLGARATADTMAIDVAGDRVTYAELDRWARAIAADLIARGIRAGDRVAVLAHHAPELCALVYGVIRARAIVVPLGLRLTRYELDELLADFAPTLIFADEEGQERLAGRDAVPITALRSLRYAVPAAPADEPRPGDRVLIVCTSGSTARPKGVTLTNATIIESAAQYAIEMPEFRPGAATMMVAPMNVSASSVQMLVCHVTGMSLFFDRVFDAERALRMLVEHRMPVLGLAPVFWERLAALPDFETADLSSLKTAWSGGARFPSQLLDALGRKGIVLRQMYGITECGGMATIASKTEAAANPDTCGFGRVFNTIRVVDEGGSYVLPGTAGEIILDTPDMMAGYWGNADASAEALREGWLYTGDLGVLDGDGMLIYVDRKKDIIVSGGLKIAAAEVERAIADFPGVEEVAVIAAADMKFGETPLAILYASGAIDVAALIAHCEARLANYKVPRYVVTSPEPLPRLAAGKLSKPAIRERYRGVEDTLDRVR